MKFLAKLIRVLSTLIAVCSLIHICSVEESLAEKIRDYKQVVLFGDPHIPGINFDGKRKVIDNVNTWEDVDLFVSLGDQCSDLGTDEEYKLVKEVFGKLKKPYIPIIGNHDFFYSDNGPDPNKPVRTSAGDKLRKFKDVFGLPGNYHTRRLGSYLLIFLAAESTDSEARMKKPQLDWLRSELEREKNLPTIIFFHGPLEGTLDTYKNNINSVGFTAQPAADIKKILRDNRQVFLWVSGHTHTPPSEKSFSADINLYEKQVLNIHNTDMNRVDIYTRSLFLYNNKVVVKTYDHFNRKWLKELEKDVLLPDFRIVD